MFHGVEETSKSCRDVRRAARCENGMRFNAKPFPSRAFGIVLAIRQGEMRTLMQRLGRRMIGAAALVVLLIGGTGLNAFDPQGDQAQDWVQRQYAMRAELEFEQVLDVVRDHRPTTNDRYRQTLAQTIVDEARAESIDPLLIAAIVARESSFNTRVVSRAGAVGLMQLRPWVAEDTATRADVEWKGVATLHEPRMNVRLGVRYFKELVERFGDERIALTAYCYGPTRVANQMRNGTFSGSRYAQEILAMYQRLHADLIV